MIPFQQHLNALPPLPPVSAQLQRAWIQWASLVWQGHSSESFPEKDQHWIEWLRHTGLVQLQEAGLVSPLQAAAMMATTALPIPNPTAPPPSEELATLRHIAPASHIALTHEATLLIPPCSHRAAIFDIQPQNSLVQALVELGHHVIVLEWNAPPNYQPLSSPAPSWSDYRATLRRHIQDLHTQHQSLHIMGLCLGGVMALDVLTDPSFQALLPPIRSLTLLSTLLDYHTLGPLSCLHWPPLRDSIRQNLSWMQWIPAPLIYAFCCALMPSKPHALSPLSEWSQQGLNVSAPFALELLDAFYAHNHLVAPSDEGGNSPLSRLRIPLYAVGGLSDRLVAIHGLFNGLHQCSPSLPVRLSLFEAGHLRCFLPGKSMKGYQGAWQGESIEHWLKQTPSKTQSSGWMEDWNQWIQLHSNSNASPG